MERRLTFHPLVQRDFNEIIDYYIEEAGAHVADRFESEFRESTKAIEANPRHFPFYLHQRRYRRHSLKTFPHIILFLETEYAIRIMVLKHIRRSPNYGLRRR